MLLALCLASVGVHEEGRKKEHSNIDTDVKYGVGSTLSWSKSKCNPEMGISRIRRSLETSGSCKGEDLEQS